MRDLANNIQAKRVLSPVSVSDNTAQVGQVIDLAGYNSATMLINIGSVADADTVVTALLEESDASGSGFSAVADTDLIGTELLAGFQYDDDNEVRKLGYVGSKQYIRLTLTPANNASAMVISAMAILGHPAIAPVTQAAS